MREMFIFAPLMRAHKQILNLAVPNIISNITVPLLGMADLAMMGHLATKEHLGAIALGTTIFNMIYMVFVFLRMSTSGFAAQSIGGGNPTESILILGRALLVSFSAAFVILILQVPLERLSFYILEASHSVEEYTRSYYRIRIWAAPATIAIFALNGWFIGMQNARIPMTIAIFINLVNILLNFVFVYYLGMDSNGVALGTVISQYAGLIMAMVFLFRRYGALLSLWSWKPMFEVDALFLFLKVNSHIFIRTIVLITSLSFFTAMSARMGDTVLAVNSILFQYFLLYSYFLDGFAYAAEALAGKYYGARQLGKLREIVKQLFVWGLGIALFFTLLYTGGNSWILRLLTGQEEVISRAGPYLFWVACIPLITFPAFLWDGIYIGVTASAPMRNAMFFSAALVYFPAYYLLHPLMGNHGLWLALMLFMLARSLSLSLMARRHIFTSR